MSWISEFAGKAETLLNKIDSNAAVVLNNKVPKKKKHIEEPLLEEVSTDGVSTLRYVTESPVDFVYEDNPQFSGRVVLEEMVQSAAPVQYTEVQNGSLKKEPLNDSRINSTETNGVANSSADIHVLKNENEMLRNEVHSLNSEISLLMNRTKTAECEIGKIKTEITNKENEVVVLNKEVISLRNKLSKTENTRSASTSENERLKLNYKTKCEEVRELEARVAELQIESQNREKLLKTDLTNLRNRLVETEENLAKAKSDNLREMSSGKARLDALREEIEEYKMRARKGLADKERLIQELKSDGGNRLQGEELELFQLKQELESSWMEQEKRESRIEVERQRADELELRLELIREESAKELSSALNRLHQESARRMAAEDTCRQHAEELYKVREELSKELSISKERGRETEAEVNRLRRQLAQRGDDKGSKMEERRVASLTQALVQKQSALEAAVNEKNQLRLQLERTKKSFGQYSMQLNNRGNTNDTDDAKAQVPHFLLETPYDTGVTRKVKRAYSCMNAVSVRTGMFLRRYPLARFFFLIYGIFLHMWVLFILFSNTPDTKM